jgi:hypothetical protein
MSIIIQQQVYTPIPEGVYQATITEILSENGKFGQQLRIKFLLDPMEGLEGGKYITALCSAKFSPKTKLYAWTTAVLGNISPKYDFNSDDLLNKPILVVTKQRLGSDGITIFDQIETIKPLRGIPSKSLEDVANQLGVEVSEIPS